MPIPEKIKLPEPGLPKGLELEDDLSATPSVPAAPPVPKPGAATGPPPVPSKPSIPPVPKKGAMAGSPPVLPKPDTPPVPAVAKDSESKKPGVKEKEKSNLQKDLLKEFDTDGDGRISEDEKPSEEQLRQFTKRRGEKPQIDQVDSKRKTRIEAETAVKNAMRELEEARVREELSAREELEAHKLTLDKAKKGMARNNEEMEKIKQADRSKHEKNEAALAKLKQEHEHGEELIRHTIRAKKAAHLDDEDRVHELDGDLHRLHEKET